MVKQKQAKIEYNFEGFYKEYLALAPSILDKPAYKIANQINYLFREQKVSQVMNLNRATNHQLVDLMVELLTKYKEVQSTYSQEIDYLIHKIKSWKVQ